MDKNVKNGQKSTSEENPFSLFDQRQQVKKTHSSLFDQRQQVKKTHSSLFDQR